MASHRTRAGAAEPAAPFRIIVHPENSVSSVSRVFLERAFLKNVHEWADGQAIRPVDLTPDSATRAAFSRAVLRRSVEAVKHYWQQRIFSGRGVPPPELAADETVLDYVLRHRGAIGYVSAATNPGRARVMTVR